MPQKEKYPDTVNGIEKKLINEVTEHDSTVETVGKRAIYDFGDFRVTIKPVYDTEASEEGNIVVDKWEVFCDKEEDPLSITDSLYFDSVRNAVERVQSISNK